MKFRRFPYQLSSSFAQSSSSSFAQSSSRVKGIFDNRRRKSRLCLCQHSYDTDFQKAVSLGSDIPSTPIDTGWLWELSAKTTRVKFDPLRVRPKKSLGQNFVNAQDVLERIAFSSSISVDEPVIEFGPGTGNLTEYLLKSGAYVTAIEKDDRLHQKLRNEYPQDSLRVIHGDVMVINSRSLIEDVLKEHPDRSRIKIVSNLPYNITTDCLKLYLPMGDIISNLLFMIQDEVAQRLCHDGKSDASYRAMTVYTHHFSHPEYLFKISKTAYFPEPQVDGALVNFKLKRPAERCHVESEKRFLSFVNKSFSSKRKKLTNSLRPLYEPEDVKAALEKSDLSENIRGQEMTYHQFVSIFASLEGV